MKGLEPKADERYLILAPHPDDETLAAGGLIQAAVKAGARVKIVYLTNGEHNFISAMLYYRRLFLNKTDFEGLGRVRREEALGAAKVLGLKEEDLCFLGYPDLGMFPMRNTSQGARVISDILSILRREEPTHIIFPDAQDGHADHRAAFLYLMESLRQADFSQGSARLLGYRVHKGLNMRRIQSSETDYYLESHEREIKRQAILRYDSQTSYRRRFLLSFAAGSERFLTFQPPPKKDLILQSEICKIK